MFSVEHRAARQYVSHYSRPRTLCPSWSSARSRAIRALFAPGSRYIKERMCESALTRIRDRPYTFLFVAMVADVVVVVAVASCRGVGRFMNTDFHSALATSNRYEAGTAFGTRDTRFLAANNTARAVMERACGTRSEGGREKSMRGYYFAMGDRIIEREDLDNCRNGGRRIGEIKRLRLNATVTPYMPCCCYYFLLKQQYSWR